MNALLLPPNRQENTKKLSLWPILAIGFFAISTGTLQVGGLPVVFILPLILSILMLIMLNLRINKAGFVFVFCLLSGYLFGSIVSIFEGTFLVSSALNLAASLAMLSVVLSYTIAWLNCDAKHTYIALQRVLIFFAVFAVVEIIYYEEVFYLRNIYYMGLLDNHHYRDVLLYGMPRPTGFFSEPSNFARFISLLLAMYMLVSLSKLKFVLWLIFFIILLRSPSMLFGVPVIFVAMYSMKKRSLNVLNLVAYALGLLAIFATLVYFQYDRILNLVGIGDESFNARIAYLFQYMFDVWSYPLLGEGPTPLSKINEYVNYRYIDLAGRDWLDGGTFRVGLSSSLVVLIGMGAIGMTVFLITATYSMGKYGFGMLLIFFFVNIFSSGVNSPIMYIPTAMALGICLHIWSKKTDQPVSIVKSSA